MDSRSSGDAMAVAVERIRRLGSHLESPGGGVADWPLLEMAACARARTAEFIRGKHMEVQEKVHEYFLSKPELQTPVEISMDEHRELCMRQLLGLVREAGISPFR